MEPSLGTEKLCKIVIVVAELGRSHITQTVIYPIEISPDGTFLYVVEADEPHDLIQIDTATYKPVGSLALGVQVDAITMSPSSNYLSANATKKIRSL